VIVSGDFLVTGISSFRTGVAQSAYLLASVPVAASFFSNLPLSIGERMFYSVRRFATDARMKSFPCDLPCPHLVLLRLRLTAGKQPFIAACPAGAVFVAIRSPVPLASVKRPLKAHRPPSPLPLPTGCPFLGHTCGHGQ